MRLSSVLMDLIGTLHVAKMAIDRFRLLYLAVLVYLSDTNFANGLLDSNHNEIELLTLSHSSLFDL